MTLGFGLAEEVFFRSPARDDVLLLSRISSFLTARLSLSSSPLLPDELETCCPFAVGLGLALFDDDDDDAGGFGCDEFLNVLFASSATGLVGKCCGLE